MDRYEFIIYSHIIIYELDYIKEIIKHDSIHFKKYQDVFRGKMKTTKIEVHHTN